MYTIGRLLLGLASLLTPLALAAPVAAQPFLHTWVASHGTDNGSCGSPSSPCATFSGAYSNTSAGGEITCLNAGAYSTLTITKSITVDCEYTFASNAQADGNPTYFDVEPLSPGIVVTLRGLDLDFLGSSGVTQCAPNIGVIVFDGEGGVLHLQKLKISHWTGPNCGIFFAPFGTGTLDITDTDITDNGTSGVGAGVYIQPQDADAVANVTITRTQIQGNFFGIIADGTKGGTIRAIVKDGVVSGNTENGITAETSGSSVWMLVDDSAVSGNTNGLVSSGTGAEILVRNTSVFNNSLGLFPKNNGTLFTYGNNSVNGNTANGAFTGTVGMQ
jgi:hypothetical protein